MGFVRWLSARSGAISPSMPSAANRGSRARGGFCSVINCDGDSAQLVETVAVKSIRKGHAAACGGAETAGRVRQALTARGFFVETQVLYEALPVTQLAPVAKQALATARSTAF
jgi:hypothetical protein